MKNSKVLIIALAAFALSLFSVNANAQVFKPTGGEKEVSVLFAPLGGSPISIGGLSFRKFNPTGTAAWRVNLFIGVNNKTGVSSQPIDTGSYATGGGRPEADAKSSSMTIGIRPGYEWHFAGTERLSPYWGVEANLTMVSASVDSGFVVDNSSNAAAGTAWQTLTCTTKGKGASTTIGLNLVMGCDFYLAKNLSLGAEFGFGCSSTSNADITSASVGRNKTSGAFEVQNNPTQKQGSAFQLGPNAVGQFKLGWSF